MPGHYGLRTQVIGYLPRGIDDYELTVESPPLEWQLEAARSVRVHLRDDAGQPLTAHALRVRAEDGWETEQREVWRGETKLRAVPLRPMEIEVDVGTRTWTQRIDGEADAVHFVVPAHGSLEIRLPEVPRLQAEDAHVRALLRERDGTGSRALSLWFDAEAESPLRLETDLLPGEYVLEVDVEEYLAPDQDEARPHVRKLARRNVAIAAGELAEIEVAGR